MAGRKVDIDEKIRKAEETVCTTKAKYDAALDRLKELHDLKNQMQKDELIEAMMKSSRSYEEIMAFLNK